MLELRRRARDPRTGAHCAVHDLLHSAFRVRVIRADGITWDEALTHPAAGWCGDGHRQQIAVVLRGHVRLREPGLVRWLVGGELAIASSLDAVETRFEPSTIALAVDYRLGSLGTRAVSGLPVHRLATSAHGRLRTAAESLARSAAESDAHVTSVLDVLRAEGLPLDAHRPSELALIITPREHAVAHVLTTTLSRLDDTPMSSDLERRLGLSRRSVVGLVARLGARFDLDDGSYRTLRRRWRVMAALALASHPRARTEDVARAVGYGSARAFCHAFADAALPSPGRVARAVAALR